MFLQGMVRQVMVIGVPLFLMLTGYLNAGKKISRAYYRGLIRVLSAYLVYSLLTIVFREILLHDHRSPWQWVHAILSFDAIPYAWYIEMWIGLFLLTPFLGVLYNGLTTKREKQVLILTLVLLSLMASFCNRYGLKVWPAFWEKIYPLAYFFLGAYIREYRPRIATRTTCAVVLAFAMLNPIAALILAPNRPMIQPFGATETPLTFIVVALCFLSMYERDTKSLRVKHLLARVSVLSLDMYLVSYMFDALFYPWFMERFFVNQRGFGIWWLVMVPLILLCSFALSAVINPLLPTGKPKQRIAS